MHGNGISPAPTFGISRPYSQHTGWPPRFLGATTSGIELDAGYAKTAQGRL